MPPHRNAPATQKDLRELEERFEARLQQMEHLVMSRFDLLMENLVHDFRAANKDKIALHEDQLQEHDRRLFEVERRSGLAQP